MASDRVKQMADDMFSSISRMIDRRLAALEQRLAAADRIKEYQPGRVYGKGVLVSYSGGLWAAAFKTAKAPGTGPSWTRVFLEETR